MIFKNEIGDKVEQGGPQYSLERSEHLGGNNRGDRIGSIMKAVNVVEYQG